MSWQQSRDAILFVRLAEKHIADDLYWQLVVGTKWKRVQVFDIAACLVSVCCVRIWACDMAATSCMPLKSPKP